MTTQERYIEACFEARALNRERAANMRLELARLTFSTMPMGLGDRTDKQRAEYNRLILAAQDVLWVIARESDLFVCTGCGEHFESQDAQPRCDSSAHNGKADGTRISRGYCENVSEDTVYCGTCLLGCERVDESGCCEDCAKAFREARRG